MKSTFFLLLISISLFSSTEQKIIIGSYPTQKHADSALKKFESKLGSQFILKQEQSYFNIVARPSGKTFIIAIEPFKSYKEASAVKAILPRMYADAFINKYVPPVVKAEIKIETTATKPQKSTKQLQPTVETSNVTTMLSKTTAKPIQEKQLNVVPPQNLETEELHIPSPLMPLQYLLIGISIIVLIFLLLFIKFYRKYHHVKEQLKDSKPTSDNSLDEKNNFQKKAKSSDIFFIRQY